MFSVTCRGFFSTQADYLQTVTLLGVATKLMGRLHGIQEYWLVNWQLKTVAVYRRNNAQLQQASTLLVGDTLTSPLLPGFSAAIADLFPG